MSIFRKVVKTFNYAGREVTMETGEIARQADASVLLTMSDTVVLATVVCNKQEDESRDFFPLTVDYVEKSYSVGRIPGGFLKREGKPADHEVLISRLIDRPIRPLFFEGFTQEVHVVVHLLSSNNQVDPAIPAFLAASCAISLSGLPFAGPVAINKVSLINSKFYLNLDKNQEKQSDLKLIVAGTKDAVLMVEAQANQLSEEQMLSAIDFGHKESLVAIQAIEEFVAQAGKPDWVKEGLWQPKEANLELIEKVKALSLDDLRQAYNLVNKKERVAACKEVYKKVLASLTQEGLVVNEANLKEILFNLEAGMIRGQILAGEPRIDGRDTRTVRDLALRTSFLARVHGSALFTRGETQALVAVTLGTEQDAQKIDVLGGDYQDTFLCHYNMPPFATGEVGKMGATKRREVGHGFLVKKALSQVLPSKKEFPYVVRLVSEITESNGSSSMASVCGGCLALLDAGVPLKAHVAGIAMGLIKEGNKFAVLTDILGDEDHLGDMDFKVARTSLGITALQMDMKIQGINNEILVVALAQAKEALIHILSFMQERVPTYNEKLSKYAPKLDVIKINPQNIKDLIGKGGATIKGITEQTGARIEVNPDGVVTISSDDQLKNDDARNYIEELLFSFQVGQIHSARVLKIADTYAIVALNSHRDAMLSIGQIAHERVNKISDYLSLDQVVKVKITEIDDKGKIKVSMKVLLD